MVASGWCSVVPWSCAREQAPEELMISSDPPPVVASGVSTSALPVPPEPVPPESGPTMRKPDPSFDAEIVVTLRNEAGLQIGFSKAEVLAAAWGEVRRTELPTDGDRLTLGLEELHGFLDSSFADGQHVLGVFLYLRSVGHAPVRSDRFLWRKDPDHPERARHLVIGFPSGESVTVDGDGKFELDLTLRWPETRFVRFVDDDRQAVRGVSVDSYMFWSSDNHCGVLSGADWLGKGVSDDDGRVRIPDGDFEYALTIEKKHHVVVDSHVNPKRFVGVLERGEAVVQLHLRATGTLDLRLMNGGEPLTGTSVMGRLADHGCGISWGPLATTDEEGRILLSGFCHEMYSKLFINNADGSVFWEADPRAWQRQGVVRVDLKDAGRN